MERDPNHETFWRLADRWIAAEKVEEGTMMGHHCLRARPDGGFVATVDRSSGDLIVKLPRSRVNELPHRRIGATFCSSRQSVQRVGWPSPPPTTNGGTSCSRSQCIS